MFLAPETDIMGQFLGPETDILGERYFMALSLQTTYLIRNLLRQVRTTDLSFEEKNWEDIHME